MKLKSLLLLASLLFLSLPSSVHAYASDTDYCGTLWPKWWWNQNGAKSQVVVENWRIEPIGLDFRIAFNLVNAGTTTFYGGMEYAVTHAAVDPAGYANPAQLTAPADVDSLLGTERLTSGVLPTLRPGQAVTVYASARGFRTDANHILTVAFFDGGEVRIDPSPNPWYWLRVLGPSSAPSSLRVVESSATEVSSTRPGYRASRIRVVLQNAGRSIIEAGIPVLMVHGSSPSAGGNYSPDQPFDPNDPGNPFAIYFREALHSGQLEQALYPGQNLVLEGTAFIPVSGTMFQQVTVELGQ
jgi:hypothetical protein